MKQLLSIVVIALSLQASGEETNFNDIKLIADTMYCEARGEGRLGMMAVGDVIMNRVKHPAWGDTITEVVLQPYQFSCFNKGYVSVDQGSKSYIEALSIAVALIEGRTPRITYATHYHTTEVKPIWRHKLGKLGQIGNHIFYIQK